MSPWTSTFLGVLAGIVLGAVLVVAALPYLSKTSFGRYLVSGVQLVPAPQATPPFAVEATTTTSSFVSFAQDAIASSTSARFASMPKPYQDALRVSVMTYADLKVKNVALANALTQVGDAASKQKYSGIFDKVAQVKLLASEVENLGASLEGNLNALQNNNVSVTDNKVQSLTTAYVTAGLKALTANTAYITAVTSLVSGSVPTVQQITNSTNAVDAFFKASSAFENTLQPLYAALGIVASSTQER